MDAENMEIDYEEYQKQYVESAEQNGLVLKVYIDEIKESKMFEGEKGSSFSTPCIMVRGKGSPIMLATLVQTLESLIEDFKKDKNVETALAFLRMITSPGKSIEVKDTMFKGGNDD